MRQSPIHNDLIRFNPRSRTGSDDIAINLGTLGAGFNPRSRTGSDPEQADKIDNAGVSIHAPVRGATSLHIDHHGQGWFQSTLPYGERQKM